jgi:hypothetical protein
MSSSHRREQSQASSSRRLPPPPSNVVTTPRKYDTQIWPFTYSRLAWAKDEPPSDDEDYSVNEESEHRTSEAHSRISSRADVPSPWWAFNDPRNRVVRPSTPRTERRSFRDVSLAWLPSSAARKNAGSLSRKGKEVDRNDIFRRPPIATDPTEPYSIPHLWIPKLEEPGEGPSRLQGIQDYSDSDDHPSREESYLRAWRSFLTNVYVPLVCSCRSQQFHNLSNTHLSSFSESSTYLSPQRPLRYLFGFGL